MDGKGGASRKPAAITSAHAWRPHGSCAYDLRPRLSYVSRRAERRGERILLKGVEPAALVDAGANVDAGDALLDHLVPSGA